MDILEKINSQRESITEADIESWIIDGVLELYKPRIIFWVKKVENNFENISDLAIRAFSEEIKTRPPRSAVSWTAEPAPAQDMFGDLDRIERRALEKIV